MKKAQIGILTFHDGFNYGTYLQKTLDFLGYANEEMAHLRLKRSRFLSSPQNQSTTRYDSIVIERDEVQTFRHPRSGFDPTYFSNGLKADFAAVDRHGNPIDFESANAVLTEDIGNSIAFLEKSLAD